MTTNFFFFFLALKQPKKTTTSGPASRKVTTGGVGSAAKKVPVAKGRGAAVTSDRGRVKCDKGVRGQVSGRGLS